MQVETVNLKINGQTVQLSFDKASGFVVKEILVDKVYPQVPFLSGVETIVDIGANVGISCLYFHFLYPSARIHAFEPGAEALALLERNAKPFPMIAIHPFGLWTQDTEASLNKSAFSCVEDSLGFGGCKVDGNETIRLHHAANALQECGLERIDILKIDTEGCEVALLTQLLGRWQPRAVYLEYHSEADRRKLDGLLQDYLLFSSHARRPHRGELCYVLKTAFPSEQALHAGEIAIDMT